MRKILNIWNKLAYSKWIVNLYFKTLLSIPWRSVSPYFHFAPVEMKKEWNICHQIQSRRRKSLPLKPIKIKLDSKGLRREFFKFSPAREGLMMIGDFLIRNSSFTLFSTFIALIVLAGLPFKIAGTSFLFDVWLKERL